jgi:hypothetical protein
MRQAQCLPVFRAHYAVTEYANSLNLQLNNVTRLQPTPQFKATVTTDGTRTENLTWVKGLTPRRMAIICSKRQ